MKNVLVVDDNAIVRKHLVGLLEREGCITYEAGHGLDALEVMAAQKIDLAFLDLHMPNLDGAGFLQAMRDRGQSVPVVLITSSESAPEISQAIRLGAGGYLSKPFKEELVRKALLQSAGYDSAGTIRQPPHVAILDHDEALSLSVRDWVPSAGSVELCEARDDVETVLAQQPHRVVLIGAFAEYDDDATPHAEVLAELVADQNPQAVRIRLLGAKEALPEASLFHFAVPRANWPALKRAVNAALSGTCLTSGRLLRALKYSGSAELEPLYWLGLAGAFESAMRQVSQEGARCQIDLRLAPNRPLEELTRRLSAFADTVMMEIQVIARP